MKSIFKLILIIILYGLILPASAKLVKVEAQQPFYSGTPTETLSIRILEKIEFTNGLVFEKNALINGLVLNIKPPKKAKISASFEFVPTEYTYDNATIKISDSGIVATYKPCKNINKLGTAASRLSSVAGFLFHIPVLSQAVSLIKGGIINQENDRIESSINQVYEDSPLALLEKGQEVILAEKQIFILKFQDKDFKNK